MKNEYETPIIDILKFTTDDIVTSSPGDPSIDDGIYDDDWDE